MIRKKENYKDLREEREMKTKSEIRYNELLREIRIKNYGKELLKRDEREEHEKIKNTTEWNDEKKSIIMKRWERRTREDSLHHRI